MSTQKDEPARPAVLNSAMPNLALPKKLSPELTALRDRLRLDAQGHRPGLAQRLDECRSRWNGHFECRSPACRGCCGRYITREQRVAQAWFGDYHHSNLAFLTVVLEAASSTAAIADIITRSRTATRNRLKACRRQSAKWNDVHILGWHEFDAVAPEHIPLLPGNRRPLVEKLAPWSISSGGPAWIGTYHSIVHLNGLSVSDVDYEFRRQWPVDGQVKVEQFYKEPVAGSIDRIVSYANKFTCLTSLSDFQVKPWPVAWKADFFQSIQDIQRNPFEALRFSVGPNQGAVNAVISNNTSQSIQPMPWSFTRLPTYIYTG